MTTALAVERPVRAPGAGVFLALAPVLVLMACLLWVEGSAFLLWVAGGTTANSVMIGALLWRAHGFTPTTLPVGIINGIAILGAVLYPSIADVAAVSFTLMPSEEDAILGIQVALVTTAALTAGALVTTPAAVRRRVTIDTAPKVLLLLGFIPLALGVLGRGPAILYSPGYGESSGVSAALEVSTALAPLAELALALAAFHRRADLRVMGLVGLAGWALLHFSGSTRQLALIPGLMLVGYLLAPSDKMRRAGPLKVAVVVYFTYQFSSMMLLLRGNPEGVGLRPLTAAVLQGRGLEFNLNAVLGNILFSSPLTSATIKAPSPLGTETFLLSVNPLPGALTDWPAVSRSLRLNFATPFNGLGELAGTGWPYVVLYGVVVGLLLGLLFRLISKTPGAAGQIAFILAIAILALFAITLSQYNLRSATRLLYYLAIATVGLSLLAPRVQNREAPAAKDLGKCS